MRLAIYLVLFVPLLAVFGAASIRSPGWEWELFGALLGGSFGVLFAFAADGRIGPDSAIANLLFGRRREDEKPIDNDDAAA